MCLVKGVHARNPTVRKNIASAIQQEYHVVLVVAVLIVITNSNNLCHNKREGNPKISNLESKYNLEIKSIK